MKITDRRGSWTIVEWKCCGNLWQLILTPKFPDRANWNPVCPNCGKTINGKKIPDKSS